MGNRRIHRLSAPVNEVKPSEVIIIGALTKRIESLLSRIDPEGGLVINNDLIAAHVIKFRLEHGKITRFSESEFSDQEEMGEYLLDNMRKGKTTWVFCMYAYEILTAIKFWDLLTTGQLILNSKQTFHDQVSNVGKVNRWRGCIITNDPPTIVVAKKPGTNDVIKILDIRNYINGGLSALFDTTDTDEEIRNLRNKASSNPIEACRLISQKTIEWFAEYWSMITSNRFGAWCNTINSQSWHSYRKSYMKERIMIHNNDEAIKLERDSFFGGRCEAYRIGLINEDIFQLDICSSYPAAVLGRSFPTELLGISTDIDNIREMTTSDKIAVIANVIIKTDIPVYPVKDDELTYFPIGEFETTLAGPELRYAFLNNHVTEIKSASIYHARNLFDDWVQQLWTLRRVVSASNNKRLVGMIKALSNSLYGKFGQRARGWRDIPARKNDRPWEQWIEKEIGSNKITNWRCIAGLVQMGYDDGETDESYPAIASYVTSLARIRLWKIMDDAGRNDCYYCDTDGIICNRSAIERLKLNGYWFGTELGMLRIVGEYRKCRIWGMKHYQLDNNITCAGLAEEIRWDKNGYGQIFQQRKSDNSLNNNMQFEQQIIRRVIKPQIKIKSGCIDKHGRVQPFKERRVD